MFAFTVISIFVLFFILIIFVKDNKTLLTIAKVFLLTILGGLLVMGILAIITGVSETQSGNFDQKQFFIQLGAGLIFIAAGGYPLYLFFIANVIAQRTFERRKKQYPDAPWMWIKQWASNRIVSSSKGPVSFVWFVLLGLMGGLAFVSYINRQEIIAKAKSPDVDFMAFFLLLAIILIPCFWFASSLLRGSIKFGNSTFEMSTYPGIIGGDLAGTIHTAIKNIPEKGFQLELRCGYLDLTPRAGRKLTNTNITKILWSETKKVPRDLLSRGLYGISIPVSFSIPADAPESDGWSPDKRILWTMIATSKISEALYLSSFDVPIFLDRSNTLQGIPQIHT